MYKLLQRSLARENAVSCTDYIFNNSREFGKSIKENKKLFPFYFSVLIDKCKSTLDNVADVTKVMIPPILDSFCA